MKVMDLKTFSQHQKVILHHIDRLFEEHLKDSNNNLRLNPSRKLRVRVEDHYFLNHREHLLKKMEGEFGLEVRVVVMRVRLVYAAVESFPVRSMCVGLLAGLT